MKHIKSIALVLVALMALGVGCESKNDNDLLNGGDQRQPDNTKKSENPSPGKVSPNDLMPDTHGEESEDDPNAAEPTAISGFYSVSTPRNEDFTPYFTIEINNVEGEKSVSGVITSLDETQFWVSRERLTVLEDKSSYDGNTIRVVFNATIGTTPELELTWNYDDSAEYMTGSLVNKETGEKFSDVEIKKQDMSNLDNRDEDLGEYVPDSDE